MKKLAALVLGLCGMTATAAADYQIDNWSVSGWQGGAYVSESNGETYCALWDDYGQGTFIWIGRDSSGIYMNITDPGDFYFTPGETFWTSVRFDTLAAANFEAYVSAYDTINIDFGYTDNLIYGLRRAIWLYLDDWGLSYTLHGTDAAVSLLEQCYWTYN